MKRYSLSDLSEPFATDFKREVEKNNFLRGGQSLLVIGPGAELETRKWHSCLLLANIPAAVVTPTEILRRLNGQYIPRDTDERRSSFEEAETLILHDLFAAETKMSKTSRSDFIWFLKEAIRDGLVLVIALDDEDPDLNFHGEALGALIEKEFEAIQHGKKSKTRTKPKAGSAVG